MRAKHKSWKSLSVPAGVSAGILLSLAVTVAGAAVCASLISSERIGQDAMEACSVVTVITASVIGALVTAFTVKRMWLQMCLLFGGCYYLLLLGITALLFNGSYTGLGTTALSVLIGTGMVAAMGAMPKNMNSARRRKRAYR